MRYKFLRIVFKTEIENEPLSESIKANFKRSILIIFRLILLEIRFISGLINVNFWHINDPFSPILVPKSYPDKLGKPKLKGKKRLKKLKIEKIINGVT